MNAIDMLLARMQASNTLACCGLDPDITKLPPELVRRYATDTERVRRFLLHVVEVAGPHVCSFKAQKAFFDGLDGGKDVLAEVVGAIHADYPGVPVFVDCKVGETKNTMKAYSELVLDTVDADGILVNPYMADEVFEALEGHPDKAVVVLVRTSNPGAAVVQDALMQDGRPLWQYMLELVTDRWNINGNLIPVLSSTADMDMQAVRKLIPQGMPILLAGVGAQGGDIGQLRALLNQDGVGVFVNSSRDILYPLNPEGLPWEKAVEEAVIRLKTELNQARR